MTCMTISRHKFAMHRIVGLLLLPLIVTVLTACSAISLMYNQANTLVYLWADKYVDFTSAQKQLFKSRLAEQLKWHRAHELPRYVAFMEKSAALSLSDMQARDFCQQIEETQQAIRVSLLHTVPDLAELAVTASPAQLEHIKEAMEKSNRDWAKKHLPASLEKQHSAHMKDVLERYEDFYGSFDREQERFLEQQLAASSWDAQRWMNERKRRQQSVLELLRAVRGAELSVAKQKIEALMQQYETPTDPMEQRWINEVRAQTCEISAAVHKKMNAKQRSHAQHKFIDYATDLAQLSKVQL
jgi:hypothetical protein